MNNFNETVMQQQTQICVKPLRAVLYGLGADQMQAYSIKKEEHYAQAQETTAF